MIKLKQAEQSFTMLCDRCDKDFVAEYADEDQWDEGYYSDGVKSDYLDMWLGNEPHGYTVAQAALSGNGEEI